MFMLVGVAQVVPLHSHKDACMFNNPVANSLTSITHIQPTDEANEAEDKESCTGHVNTKLWVNIQISGSPLGRPPLPFCHVHPALLIPIQTSLLNISHWINTHTHTAPFIILKRSPSSMAKRPVLLIILCINKWQICVT